MKSQAIRRVGILASSTLAAAILALTASAATAPVVMTAKNPALHKTILVNRSGLTLYSLSAERHGRFICTGSCLTLWHPLIVKKGVKPHGVRGLGTVRRPEGRTQVTYHGGPLYTFYLDRKRGDIGGNGFKDVGVWRPAAVAT
jgi:predicted lipoprotein with Yx(FWY)xxD motif